MTETKRCTQVRNGTVAEPPYMAIAIGFIDAFLGYAILLVSYSCMIELQFVQWSNLESAKARLMPCTVLDLCIEYLERIPSI